jgi:hypothetical protein
MKSLKLIVWLVSVAPAAAQTGDVEERAYPFSNLSLDCVAAEATESGMCVSEFFVVTYQIVPAITWLDNEYLVVRMRDIIDQLADVPTDFLSGVELLEPDYDTRAPTGTRTFDIPGQGGFCHSGVAERPETDHWLLPPRQWRSDNAGGPLKRVDTQTVSAYRCFGWSGHDISILVDFYPRFMSPLKEAEVTIIQAYMLSIDNWR